MEVRDETPSSDDRASAAVKDALYLSALGQADRMANASDAMRLQVMLGGFEAMLLDEEEETDRMPAPDDPAVRAFFLHQSIVLRTTRHAVEARVATARVLRDTLPKTWAVFIDGRATERCVTAAAEQAEGLAADLRPAYDAVAADLVQTERPAVIERELGRLRDRLDPAGASDRHRRETDRRHVRTRLDRDGQGTLTIRAAAADIAAMQDKIHHDAVVAHGREGECRTLDQLKADKVVDSILAAPAAEPTEAGSPSYPLERLGSTDAPERKSVQATILVVVPAATAAGVSDEPAEIAGMGPMDADTARHLIAHTATWTRVLVDPIDDTVLGIDTHEWYIPAGLKKLIHLRMPTCVGDDCGLPAHRADIDHVTRYEHDGRTRHDNLQPLCRQSHRMKDEGYLRTRMDEHGIPVTRTKWGAERRARVAFRVRKVTRYPDEAPF